VVPGAGGGMQLRLPPRFGAGTLKAAAWHVRARVYTVARERGPAGGVTRCVSGAARGPARRGQTRGGAQGCPVAPGRLPPRMPGAARAMSAHAVSRSGSPAYLRVVLGWLTMRSAVSIAIVQSERMLSEHRATPAQRAAPPGSGGVRRDATLSRRRRRLRCPPAGAGAGGGGAVGAVHRGDRAPHPALGPARPAHLQDARGVHPRAWRGRALAARGRGARLGRNRRAGGPG